MRAMLIPLFLLAAGAAQAGEQAVRFEGDGLLRIARLLPLIGDDGFECIVPEEFSFAGLRLGDPPAALDRLGPPKSLTDGGSEDDGGYYTIISHDYGGLTIEMVRERVDVVTAADTRWPTPSGLHVGMTRGGLYAALGRRPGPDYATEAGFSFPACPSPDGRTWDWMYMDLKFNTDGRLATISLITDRP